MEKKKMSVREMTTLAMLIAIEMVMGLIPSVGYIQVGPVALTISHIPVIIAAFTNGLLGGGVTGLVFGLTSWFVASTRAATPIDLLFVNPLVSVVPRLLFGLCVGLLRQVFCKGKATSIKAAVIAFVSTIIHTILVFTALYLVNKEVAMTISSASGTIQSFLPYIIGAFSVNALLEAAAAALVMFILIKAIGRYINQ